MDWIVNQVLGKSPPEKSSIVNIYAFWCSGEFYVETIDYNYPLDYVQQKFVSTLVDREMASVSSSNIPEQLLKTRIREKFLVESSIHVVLNKHRNRLLLTEENTNPKVSNRGTGAYDKSVVLLKSLAQIITASPETFGEVDKMSLAMSANNQLWPHKNYSVMKVGQYLTLMEAIEKVGLDPGSYEDMNILFIDFNDQKAISYITKQIGDRFVDKSPYISTLYIDIGERNLAPPTIIVDSYKQNEQTLVRVLIGALMKSAKTPYLNRMKTALERQRYVGYDVQDMYFINFSNAQEIKNSASVFDKDASTESKQKIQGMADRLGIDRRDQDAYDFLKMFAIYRSVFPPSDANIQYKTYYNIVSVPKGEDSVPGDFATSNTKLFETIFTIRDIKASNDRVYYLLSSRFCFPDRVFRLFRGDADSEGAADLHETIEFNSRNGMLSKYGFVNNPPMDRREATFYALNVTKDFSSVLVNLLGNYVKDNRLDERVTVKLLSEFPYAYKNVKTAFDREQVDYKDIPVILVYMPMDKSTLGGYLGKTKANAEAEKLADYNREFSLPFIIINVANERMQSRENLSNALIHEGRHYLDDLLVQMGSYDADYMGKDNPPPPRTKQEQLRNQIAYLETPTEVSAHAEQALSILRHYDLNYLLSHWHSMKTKILNDEFVGIDEKDHDSYRLIERYGKILDRALEIYVSEEQAKEKLEDQPTV